MLSAFPTNKNAPCLNVPVSRPISKAPYWGRSGVAAILQVDFKNTTKEQANGQAVDWLNADR
jgi:hypothetical protein